MKKLLISIALTAVFFVFVTIGGSYFLLDFALSPDEARTDTAQSFRQLAEKYPEVTPWIDSLKAVHALRDTFVTMPTGERHHAYYVRHDNSQQIAIVLHGWRISAIQDMHIGRIYHQQLGCNLLMPDLHAHGLSEGDVIGMGWQERFDVLHWMTVAAKLFNTGNFIVHGTSMGGATAMNIAGESMPDVVSNVRFVEDCGYTSVWDEFSYELEEEFGLPAFPLLYASSLLCKITNGWSFGEAAPLKQVRKSKYKMLFIHGDSDLFVPSWMVRPLYEAKPTDKLLWITKNTEHAKSYKYHPEEYVRRIHDFINKP